MSAYSDDWNLEDLGSLARFTGGNGFRDELQGNSSGDYPFIKVSDMELPGNKRYIIEANNWISERVRKREGFKKFPKEAVVFAKVGAALLLNRRRILSRETCIDNNMMAAVPNGIEPLFLFYILSSIDFAFFVQSGAVPSVNQGQLSGLRFKIPLKPEQTKIAEILSTVDQAIEQTEALIAKQQRVKTGLMQDLLTRGINEHGNLRSEATHDFKDSPLGRIPVEWEVKVLGEISEVSSGITLGNIPEAADAVDLPYLRVANVQDGFLDLSEITYLKVPRSYLKRFRLKKGDVLMNEGGDFDKLGRGTVWRGEIELCLHQNHVFKVRPESKILNSDFLSYISASPYGKAFFIRSSKQSTNLASINSTQLKSFPIPLPRFAEQKQIVSLLDSQDKSWSEISRTMFKLRAIKTSLMQDLLTGRKRVHELLVLNTTHK